MRIKFMGEGSLDGWAGRQKIDDGLPCQRRYTHKTLNFNAST